MEIRMPQEKPLDEQQVESLEEMNHCNLCGTALQFQHQTDYLNLRVREDAHCPSCRIHLQAKIFILQ